MTQLSYAAVEVIRSQCPDITPRVGLILGSGLHPLAELITNHVTIPYDVLPGFHECSVSGHVGCLHLGSLAGVPVVCLSGRAHWYEGDVSESIKTMVRTVKLLGAETILITNAAGSLCPERQPGDLVVISDHLNFQGQNPLLGSNEDDFGSRFTGMQEAYDPEFRSLLLSIAAELNITLTEGIYTGVLGPMFETPAEIRAFRLLGGDVVGMSTLPEVIVARHCGLRVAVVSAITNMAAGLSDVMLSHDVTLRGAQKASEHLVRLTQAFLASYPAVLSV